MFKLLQKCKFLRKIFNKTLDANMREVQELVTDLKTNFGYNDVLVKLTKGNKAEVLAKENGRSMKIDMDFNTRSMLQTEEKSSYILLPWLPHCKTKTIAKGTMDGDVKLIWDISKRSDKSGQNFIEETILTNPKTGTTYKRVLTPNNREFYKKIGDIYYPLFK